MHRDPIGQVIYSEGHLFVFEFKTSYKYVAFVLYFRRRLILRRSILQNFTDYDEETSGRHICLQRALVYLKSASQRVLFVISFGVSFLNDESQFQSTDMPKTRANVQGAVKNRETNISSQPSPHPPHSSFLHAVCVLNTS